jgi:asparagine synthase (glutamine-hydrolysing)
VLLSGGLDASSLTALAAEQLGRQGDKIRSLSVDFVRLKDNFQPDSMRATPDSPFVHEVADHVGSLHQDIVLPHAALIDPAGRKAVITARDFPIGIADVDVSLYWLCKAIREHSTVALSGEGSDELFAGYPWFHDPVVRKADIFPWMVPVLTAGTDATATPLINLEFAGAIDVLGYIQGRYREMISEVEPLEGEGDHERRMRIVSYAHLTRFLPALLDRKDRISMSVGLEVRVPFVDHRLVEYVYNTPWAMKTLDGREKSLLRAAVGSLLQRSVVERVKSPYPSTQDPGYAAELQRMGKELLAERDHPVFRIMNREWMDETVKLDPTAMPGGAREGLDRALDLGTWLDLYKPEIRVS